MIVQLTECNGANRGLFSDIASHSCVSAWVESVLRKECEFMPLDFSVMINGKNFTVLEAGKEKLTAQLALREIKNLPVQFETIPNDWMKIKADAFERELFIHIRVPY